MLKFDPTTHQYTEGGRILPSVTQTLQGAGLIDFSSINPDVLQRAADFGQAVHQATALDDVGDLDELTLDENLKGPLEAWRDFRGDMKFDAIEQPLYSPIYLVAGCPDRIAGNTIYDIKTSTVIYPSVGIQLAGYAILADMPTARRIAVQLRADGTFHVHEFKERRDRQVFLSCLAIYNWKINNGG